MMIEILIDENKFGIFNTSIYIEYEDVTGREYWWNLYNDEYGYDEESYELFRYLYLNYKSHNIPNDFWLFYENDFDNEVQKDIEYLFCELEENEEEKIKNELSLRSKESLFLLRNTLEKQLKECFEDKINKVLEIVKEQIELKKEKYARKTNKNINIKSN